MEYPIEIRACNIDACAQGAILCHVFDLASSVLVCEALASMYLHVVAYDAQGNIVRTYDNR